MTIVVGKTTKSEVRREIRAIRDTTREVSKSKESARAFLQKNGFITRNNKLREKYR